MNEKENYLLQAYNALKEKYYDPLERAEQAIIQVYPNALDNTTDAWNALKDKEQIKHFYCDFVTADYAIFYNLDLNKQHDLEQAQKATREALHNFLNKIKGNPNEGGKNAFKNFLQELHDYNTKNDFQCNLLPADSSMKPLNFPKSTLSIIAGRPSAGKTTALASVAMYAMRSTNKRVLFITSEETPQQLFLRFIKNEFYFLCVLDGRGHLLAHDFSKNYVNDTFKDIIKKAYFPTDIIPTAPQDEFTRYVVKAAQNIQQYVESERMQLFNLDKTTTFEELKHIMQEQARHTVVIIDYIQNLPHAPSEKRGVDRMEILRSEIYIINQIIKVNELIGIAGAQFNREGASEFNPDTLELNKLGDSGEIERKAHIVIGLGRKYNNDKWQYFYRVLKDREGATSAAHFEIMNNSEYAYSYLQAKTQENNGMQELVIMNLQDKKTKPAKGEKNTSNSGPEPEPTPQNSNEKTNEAGPAVKMFLKPDWF